MFEAEFPAKGAPACLPVRDRMETSRFLRGIRDGDPGAFDFLLSEEALRAHIVAYHVTGNGPLAEEVVGKAFLEIREGRSQVDEEDGKAGITRLVARMAVDAARERAVSQRQENGNVASAAPEPGPEAAPEGPLPPEVAGAVSEGLRTIPADMRAA